MNCGSPVANTTYGEDRSAAETRVIPCDVMSVTGPVVIQCDVMSVTKPRVIPCDVMSVPGCRIRYVLVTWFLVQLTYNGGDAMGYRHVWCGAFTPGQPSAQRSMGAVTVRWCLDFCERQTASYPYIGLRRNGGRASRIVTVWPRYRRPPETGRGHVAMAWRVGDGGMDSPSVSIQISTNVLITMAAVTRRVTTLRAASPAPVETATARLELAVWILTTAPPTTAGVTTIVPTPRVATAVHVGRDISQTTQGVQISMSVTLTMVDAPSTVPTPKVATAVAVAMDICLTVWNATASQPFADIDECSSYNGGCEHHCNNTMGGFHCTCSPGYQRIGTKCTDIDECARDNEGCEQECHNMCTAGSHLCRCRVGYQQEAGVCTDIGECRDSPCEQSCHNVDGGFYCYSGPGWAIMEDNVTCTECQKCDSRYSNTTPIWVYIVIGLLGAVVIAMAVVIFMMWRRRVGANDTNTTAGTSRPLDLHPGSERAVPASPAAVSREDRPIDPEVSGAPADSQYEQIKLYTNSEAGQGVYEKVA